MDGGIKVKGPRVLRKKKAKLVTEDVDISLDASLPLHPVASTSSSQSSTYTTPITFPPNELLPCSHCRTLLPISNFPLRHTNLTPYSYCAEHDFYWTTAKKKQWAPRVVTNRDGLLREVAALDENQEGVWVADGNEDDCEELTHLIAEVCQREIKKLPFRKSRPTVKGTRPPDTHHYLLNATTTSERTLRLSITHNTLLNMFSVLLGPEKEKSVGYAWRKDTGTGRNPRVRSKKKNTAGTGIEAGAEFAGDEDREDEEARSGVLQEVVPDEYAEIIVSPLPPTPPPPTTSKQSKSRPPAKSKTSSANTSKSSRPPAKRKATSSNLNFDSHDDFTRSTTPPLTPQDHSVAMTLASLSASPIRRPPHHPADIPVHSSYPSPPPPKRAKRARITTMPFPIGYVPDGQGLFGGSSTLSTDGPNTSNHPTSLPTTTMFAPPFSFHPMPTLPALAQPSSSTSTTEIQTTTPLPLPNAFNLPQHQTFPYLQLQHLPFPLPSAQLPINHHLKDGVTPLSLAELLASPFLGSPPLPTRKEKERERERNKRAGGSPLKGLQTLREENEEGNDNEEDELFSSSEEGSSSEGEDEEDAEGGEGEEDEDSEELLPESSEEEEDDSEEEEDEGDSDGSEDVWLESFVKKELGALGRNGTEEKIGGGRRRRRSGAEDADGA